MQKMQKSKELLIKVVGAAVVVSTVHWILIL
jgi:hypothetical protein